MPVVQDKPLTENALALIDERSYITTMARIRKSDEIRTRLLEIGLKTFANRGYHGTGIKEIVESAGVPKGSFYNYFKSKEDFGIEIIRRHSLEFWETLERCFDRGIPDPIDALNTCFEKMITEHEECTVFHCSIVGNLVVELSEHSVPCKATIATFYSHWLENLATHIKRAQELGIARIDVPCDDLVMLFWDAWHGALFRVRIEDSTELLKRSVSFVLQKIIRS